MKIQPLVALDIGSTKVACAIGLPLERGAGVELLGSSLVAYPTLSDGWPSDLLMVSRTIEQALEATAVTGDFHRALVCLSDGSLRSEHAHVAITLADEPISVRTHDLERLQQCALDRTLGVDREPLLVERLGCAGNGFEGIRDPRGLSATRLVGDFHLVTMPMALRRALVQTVEAAGLEVATLAYTLPAVFAGAADDALRHRRALVVDLGGTSTDLGVFVEGVLRRCAVVSWGGLTLAHTLANALQVTLDQAVAWSLEGTACRKPEARRLIEAHWATLQRAITAILQEQPRPDAVLVTGRGALMDGFAEWAERTTGVKTALGRSPRTARLGDVSRQVGLTAAIGLLERATQAPDGHAARSPHLFNRLIDRTRTILTEYF